MEIFRQALPEIYVFLLGFILFVAFGSFFAVSRLKRTERLIRNTPRKKLGFCKSGVVAIAGRAESIERQPLRAPLTDAACVWYRCSVEKYDFERQLDRNSTVRWSNVRSRTSTVPFLVGDGSGYCIVAPDCKDITPKDESLWLGNSPVPTDRNPPKFGPYLSSLQPQYADNATQQYRYKEARIYPGDDLFIIGEMAKVPPPEPDYDDEDPYEESPDEEIENRATNDPEDADEASNSAEDKLEEMFDRFEEEDESRALSEGRRRTEWMLTKVRLISALPPEELVKQLSGGAKGLFIIGWIALVVAAYVTWLRFNL